MFINYKQVFYNSVLEHLKNSILALDAHKSSKVCLTKTNDVLTFMLNFLLKNIVYCYKTGTFFWRLVL